MKQLLLLNPRKRRRSSRRRLRSSRRTRRNPSILGLNFGGKKKRRKRRSSGKLRKRVHKFLTKKRESILSRNRLKSLSGFLTGHGRRRKSTSSSPMKRTHRRSYRRRSHPRVMRSTRILRANPVDIQALFSPTNIGIAGGVVAGTQVTSFVLNNWSASLPGATSSTGQLFYRFAIPAGVGVALAKWSKSAIVEAIGLGFVISGLVNAGGSLVSMFTMPAPVMIPAPASSSTAATNAYLGRRMTRPMRAYLGDMPRIVRNLPVAMNGAFKNDAWNTN